MIKVCKGCGRLSNEPLGVNKNGEPYLACCPDNDYRVISAVEWYALEESQLALDWYNKKITASQFVEKKLNLVEQAKEMEEEQRNNLPIHIHEGLSNLHVEIVDGVVHVKPNPANDSELEYGSSAFEYGTKAFTEENEFSLFFSSDINK
jgi:hypothetical protein